jgi:hypothetical protein
MNLPIVEDLRAGNQAVTHIRTVPWGKTWRTDEPALCGSRPQGYWFLTAGPCTCQGCLEALQAS